MNIPLLAIDIRTGGRDPMRHQLIAIGTYLHCPDGYTEKKKFIFDFDYSNFELRCWKDFWTQNRPLLDYYKQYKKDTIHDFIDYIDKLDAKHDEIQILTDNPVFDIGFINAKLAPFDRHLQYPLKGGYRIPIDANSFFLSAMIQRNKKYLNHSYVSIETIIKEYNLDIPPIEITPENEAEQLCKLFFIIIK